MKVLTRIARSTLLYLVLINALLMIRCIATQSAFPFRISLCVICPILCAVLSYLAERNRAKGM